jgi:hypothetical protein
MCNTVLAVVGTLAFGAVANVSRAADELPRFALSAIAIGAASRNDLGIGMLEGRAILSRHLFAAAAPTILNVEGADTEYQFRAAMTVLLQWGPLRLDDRNLWVFSDAGTTRYRNRLRLTAPVELSGRIMRFQLFDEAFYEQGGRGWFRNLMGAGVGVDVSRSFSVDAYWMLQDDAHRPRTSMFVIVLNRSIT